LLVAYNKQGFVFWWELLIEPIVYFRSMQSRSVRQFFINSPLASVLFQSTRPRGARPLTRSFPYRAEIVSIHAPARGATIPSNFDIVFPVFQSTRPRGARLFHQILILFFLCFNPRARAGRDHIHENISIVDAVSIHAPARGATIPSNFDIVFPVFQSTRPRGARPYP